jgi:hypothetical protein
VDHVIRMRNELMRLKVFAAVAAVALVAVSAFLAFELNRGPDFQVPHDQPVVARQPFNGKSGLAEVVFVLRHSQATSVSVAGSFNDWKPGTLNLEKKGDDLWVANVTLPQGRYEYMFVVDGAEWVTDPCARAFADDGFGNQNAVLTVNK